MHRPWYSIELRHLLVLVEKFECGFNVENVACATVSTLYCNILNRIRRLERCLIDKT